jgi:hypothetical protein
MLVTLPAAYPGAVASVAWQVTAVTVSGAEVSYRGVAHQPGSQVELPADAVVICANQIVDSDGGESVDVEVYRVEALSTGGPVLARERYLTHLPTRDHRWLWAAATSVTVALVTGPAARLGLLNPPPAARVPPAEPPTPAARPPTPCRGP